MNRSVPTKCDAAIDDGGRTAGWLTATLIYWFLLLNLMHLPAAQLPEGLQPGAGNDGFAHTGAYAVFAFLVCRTLDAFYGRRHAGANAPMGAYAFVFFGFVAYGFVDEQTQPLTGRTAEDADWAADTIGAALGIAGHVLSEIVFGGRHTTPRANLPAATISEELVATVRSVEVEIPRRRSKRRKRKRRRDD